MLPDYGAEQGWLAVVKKWLTIIFVALLVFSAIVFALALLLHDNKEKTEQYQRQQLQAEIANAEQQRAIAENALPAASVVAQQKAEALLRENLKNLTLIENKKKIVLEHITCSDNSQCKLFDTGRIELGCVVAVNGIGKTMLDNTAYMERSAECEEQISALNASCRHNICTVE